MSMYGPSFIGQYTQRQRLSPPVNWRLSILSAYDSYGNSTSVIAGSSANMALPQIIVNQCSANPLTVSSMNANNSLVVTVVSNNHNLINGQPIQVNGANNSFANGLFPVGTVLDSNTFTYTTFTSVSNVGSIFNSSTTSINAATGTSRTISYKFPSIIQPGAMIYFNSQSAQFWNVNVFTSYDSTDGNTGTWTNIGWQPIAPVGRQGNPGSQLNGVGQAINLPADANTKWVKLTVTNSDPTSMFYIYPGAFQFPANAAPDMWIVNGMSITTDCMEPNAVRTQIQQWFPNRDPVVINYARPGANGLAIFQQETTITPTLFPNAKFYLLDIGPNDFVYSGFRPYANTTAQNQAVISTNMNTCASYLKAAGKLVFIPTVNYGNYNIAPLVNGTANTANGSQPFNDYQVAPTIRSITPWCWDGRIESASMDGYMATLDSFETSMASDGLHMNTAGAVFYRREWQNAFNYVYNGYRGITWLESAVAAASNGTYPLRKQRLVDLYNALPPTNNPLAITYRSNLSNTINAVSTTYTDPTGTTPLTVSASANLVAWFDSSDWSMVTLNGTDISALVDRSSSGYKVTQATAAQQPEWVGGAINGYAAANFVAPQSLLGTTSTSPSIAGLFNALAPAQQPFSIFFVIQAATSALADVLGFSTGGTDYILVGQQSGKNALRIITGGSVLITEPSTVDTVLGNTYVYSLIYDGTTLSLRRDGGTATSVSFNKAAWTQASQQFRYGGKASSTSNGWTGYIGDIVIFNAALNTTDRQALEQFFRTKWGTA